MLFKIFNMDGDNLITRMNELGAAREPFLFIIDFEMTQPLVYPLRELESTGIQYKFNALSNAQSKAISKRELLPVELTRYPMDKNSYKQAFNEVKRNIQHGNSFLVNLTFPTPIDLNLDLEDIFHLSEARYKLLVPGHFVVFSPEIFVRIFNGRIYSHPMKGTIDAAVSNAREMILKDPKERAEHATIVDLIRNDLSMIANDVQVDRFRYVEEIRTHQKKLLQVSSEISGSMPEDFHKHLGELFVRLLPAGSISGAPKPKTLEIIEQAENYQRGYYTGVFGVFDGYDLDSAVMIRFIEQTEEGYVYKSGGGITAFSECEKEYQELIDKVYVPVY